MSATRPPDGLYTVSVRSLCEFAAKVGDLDLRFTPSPSAQQGREGHQLVASRRPPGHESEVSLEGTFDALRVRGRADGYDPVDNVLEEVKTFRGAVEAIAPNHGALHWAQLKVYGWLMCQSRGLARITLTLVYLDVADFVEHPFSEECSADELKAFFASLCQPFLTWARREMAHRQARDAALQALSFPQLPFRAGQRELAAAVYRSVVQSRALLAQAPTGIGKTLGTLYPALRALPERGVDKLFFLTAKTPGRQVALDTLRSLQAPASERPTLRVLELVARDKVCEHPDKACHGQSCPLAQGFYDRLSAARADAVTRGWLDQAALRAVALSHGVCPYYLGQEMARWSDVVVGDYNYYFDRSAMLYALTQQHGWRVSLLVDEAHNLYSRACAMYSAELGEAQTVALRAQVPAPLRARVDELLNQWQLLLPAEPPPPAWQLLDAVPPNWQRALQRFNSAVGEYLNDHAADTHGEWLAFYFDTLAWATLAEEFGEHSLCELTCDAPADVPRAAAEVAQADWIGAESGQGANGHVALRCVVPGHFIQARLAAADSVVLFSATLNPVDYHTHLLGLPQDTQAVDISSPFAPEQLAVRILPISTRRDDRFATLDRLVDTMAQQFAAQPGNYLAFFSSFDYLEAALVCLQERHPGLPVWSQARQMGEASRTAFLQRFDAAGQGIGFAVLGGVFGEGVDLPGRRLIGAFIATLGLPQFDDFNQAVCERLEARFGRGYDYTYRLPGLQKVVQAAGRVIRTPEDRGTIVLLDARYRERRYRDLLPAWWGLDG
ncbi:MAG: ATP-dependent DNA helicase [Burkholderiales bacterium]|nr:ATP-dependent DNA helicase [Burkholderiales bacterium]